ncbi:MAG TPA: carbohydrate kinase [Verrucomicrobiae bacterium]|jgi:fructokinase
MKLKVIGIGEVLWDLLPAGRQLGGAPANFSVHAKRLGAQAQLISRLGRDDLGHAILERLIEMGVDVAAIQSDDQAPTGTASVELNQGGVPHFVIQENVAWDHLSMTEKARTVVQAADAICFGTLAQRHESSRVAIQSLIAVARPDALKVFDVNLRQNFFSRELIKTSLKLANILKLNDEELPVLAKFFGLTGEPEEQIAELAQQFDLKLVALTCGARGSLFYSRGDYSRVPGLPAKVVDTVGAGDAFTATLTLGVLAGWDLDRINRSASEVAAYVVSQPGATPCLPEQLRFFEAFSLNAVA